MKPVIRCKMRVSEVSRYLDGKGETTQERVKLQAVYGEEGTENRQWSRWTPCANFDISINNPEAMGKLANGHEFFVDFTPAQLDSPPPPNPPPPDPPQPDPEG